MKKIIMILVALGLTAAVSMAAIVNQGADSTSVNPGDTGSLTLANFDGTSGNFVIVSVSSKVGGSDTNGNSSAVSAVTYGGSGMTHLGGGFAHSSNYGLYTDLYAIFTSGTGDISLNYDMGGENDHDSVSIIAASYSGVGGYNLAGLTSDGTPVGAYDNKVNDSITTIGTGSMIVVGLGIGSPSVTATIADDSQPADYTLIDTENGSAKGWNALFQLDAATAGLYGINTDMSGANRLSQVGVELVVPEPATVGMLGLGAIVALLVRRVRA